jgi:hypothetical protein
MSAEAQEMQEAENMIEQAIQKQEDKTTSEAPELTAVEKEAIESGWKPKDAYIEEGGDPEKWSPAREFVKYGKLQQAMKDQAAKFDRKAKEFDERLENVNKLHKSQLKAAIEEQKRIMRTAASEADVQTYDDAQKQIEHLEGQMEETSQPQKDPSIVEWESNNPWINDLEDPRAMAAQGAWNNYVAQNPNATVQQALDHVDRMVAKISPSTNPLRDAPPVTETAGKSTQRSKSRNLSMNDLTQDERFMWAQTGASMWGGDETKFLKACADARKGA